MAGVHRTPLLLCLGLVLLVGAWVFANPPSAAPDETANYVKALGAGAGELAGSEPPAAARAESVRLGALSTRAQGESPEMAARAAEWRWDTTRTFSVPAELLAARFGCRAHRPELSWSCLDGRAGAAPAGEARTGSYIGTYPPFAYVPAGVAARQGAEPQAAMRLGRIAMAAIALGLLVAAVFLLFDPRAPGLSLLGLIAAATPMVVFLSSTLSASGPEVAAAICFAAALARLSRSANRPGWAWVALAVAGCVLALSRQLGPGLLVLAVVGAVLVFGRGGGWARGRAAVAAWASIAVASAIGLWWNFAYQPSPPGGLGDALRELPWAIGQLRSLLKQEVGEFGALDSPLPAPAYLAWLVLLAALLWFSLRAADRAGRLRLAVLAAGVAAATVGIAVIHRQTGFVLQGRYVLPLFVLVPIYAGELLLRNRERLSAVVATRLVAGSAAVAGAVQVAAWYANGRDVAVGTSGSWLFPFDAQWAPPLGWPLWTAVVLAAGAAFALAGVAALRPGYRPRDEPRKDLLVQVG